MSLSDLYAFMEANDEEMAKEAQELDKLAAEEDAAGRIMARGFMDELNKLGQFTIPPLKGQAAAGALKGKAVHKAPAAGKKTTFVNPQAGKAQPGTKAGQKAMRGAYK